MNKATIKYLPSLGSYLDEINYKWYNNNDGSIEIYYDNPEELFSLGVAYANFMVEAEDEDRYFL